MPLQKAYTVDEEKEQSVYFGITPGTPVLVELKGLGGRFKTYFVGLVPNKSFITRMPMAIDVREHIYPDKNVMVRFLSEGVIYSFKASIDGSIMRPVPLLFVSYPDKIEVVNLRKSQRVDCFLPVIAHLDELRYEGMITNISTSGCLMSFAKEDAKMVDLVKEGSTFQSEFFFFDKSDTLHVDSKVKSIKHGEIPSLGIEFISLKQELKQHLEKYVETIRQYLGYS
ncbi:flagellar brake protein [Desulfovibrio inopinatus]|uniref:flagellar brake protein n=1 Tax=Desulfovibrio inopinatus TaxID=102109 RepID=UPI0004288EF1|nr:flagellar brake protein [Desulfovibrio inopinatus]